MVQRLRTHGVKKSKEDTIMKKFISRIRELENWAALLMAGAAFAACSSSSDEIIDKQSANPMAPKVYTMVIKASKGSDAATRALREEYDEMFDEYTLDAYWSGDETFEVLQSNNIIGTATAAASTTGNTTITAILTEAPNAEDNIKFYLNSKEGLCDYTGQVGLLTGTGGNSISEKYDYAKATLSASKFSVDGNQINTDATLKFDNHALQAIVKFTLKDKSDNAINATKLNIHDSEGNLQQSFDNTNDNETFGDVTISPSSGNDVIYTALRGVQKSNLTLTANDGDNIYSYSRSEVTFNNSKYYDITVKMNKILARLNMSNVAAVAGGGYKSITAKQAKELAKQCWTVAGVEDNYVYVVYAISGTYPMISVSYASYDGSDATTTTTDASGLAELYNGTSTAWFVEPVPAATGHALSSTQVAKSSVATDWHTQATPITTYLRA